MTKTHSIRPPLSAATVTALAALALAATPAQAGVFGFVKSALKAEAGKRIGAELDRRGVSAQADAANETADQTAAGVWVASGDMTGDGRDDSCAGRKLEQNGTTVASAAEVQAPQGEGQAALLLPAVQKAHEPAKPQRAKLKQNGTTVATAGEVQAPQGEGQAALLLPAVQKVRESSKSQRAKLKQNGTTVATAGEVRAPGNGARAGLLLPAVQKVRLQPQPQRAKLKQNGTTVATAGNITARSRN
jgi:hypothetical protein